MIKPTTVGLTKPAVVPTVLQMPMMILAYRGAMSSMFTVYAGNASEVVIPARLIQTTTTVTFKE